jgi:hypothetical protein
MVIYKYLVRLQYGQMEKKDPKAFRFLLLGNNELAGELH